MLNGQSAYHDLISRPVKIAPIITFRILFGALMMVGALRFMQQGWIEKLYLEPTFFFKFYGFEWAVPFSGTGMYLLYGLIALSSAMIMLGFCYRLATLLFFLSFTYSELVDATNYLNHYYLVCLLAFLLLFIPANKRFSLDVRLGWTTPVNTISAWMLHALLLQIGLVYFFAGYAKLNSEWLFRAMPMAIWLPAEKDFPILGPLFAFPWTPWLFSWAGAIYDLSIAFLLLYRPTRPFAYIAVIIFHVLTKLLFNIGLFPFIMIFSTLLFFSPEFHERLLSWIGYQKEINTQATYKHPWFTSFLRPFLFIYFVIQLTLPLRYLVYPGNVLWTEQGYRFAWRVMLVEKSGHITFLVKDPVSGRQGEVVNANYLTAYQEKQMAIQPDFILQFAHFIHKEYQHKYNIEDPIITVNSFVALNGRPSQRFIKPNVNLVKIKDGFQHKDWIYPFNPKGIEKK